jgi:hypothetical protein
MGGSAVRDLPKQLRYSITPSAEVLLGVLECRRERQAECPMARQVVECSLDRKVGYRRVPVSAFRAARLAVRVPDWDQLV